MDDSRGEWNFATTVRFALPDLCHLCQGRREPPRGFKPKSDLSGGTGLAIGGA